MAGKDKTSGETDDQAEDATPKDAATDAEEITGTDTPGGEDTLPAETPDPEAVVMVEPVDADTVSATGATDTLAAEDVTPPDVDLTQPEHDPRGPESPLLAQNAEETVAAAEPEAQPETRPEPVAPPPPAPAPEKTSRGGFFPALLGGIVAGALGFGIAWYLLQQDSAGLSGRVDQIAEQQSQQGASLSELADTVSAGPDLSALTGRLDELGSQVTDLSGRLDSAAGDFSTLSDRLTELEKRPISEGVSEEAIAAYESELARLQEAMAQQRQEVEALIAEAREMEADAAESSEMTLRRAALTRILSALDNGSAFAPALSDLQGAGQEVPEALAAVAETGVPSMAALRDSYPEAARQALAAARSDGDGGMSSVGDFLRTQLGARSLEPKDGADPDAVLSRAEAALRGGRLSDALAELETLPESARAEMANWIASATSRQKAVAAAEELSAALNAG